MYVYKDLLELAGLTTRLYTLLSTLHNLPHPVVPDGADQDKIAVRDVDVGVPSAAPAFVAAAASETSGLNSSEDLTLSLSEAEEAAASKAASSVLVKGLSFDLKAGEHLMITGSNGVGKTAIARVLAGLWAAQGGGRVSRPQGKKGVFVVPQRAYMVTGTLLDQ